ncbi:MAG: metallophosphoesterase [Spirochaetaceae bacterium]|nr:MAG: metallophosphoesterase [Spirochaetaceae bacterium]
MRAIWLTDIHLEFLDEQALQVFMQRLGEQNGDAVLISGDIAQAQTVCDYLARMADFLEKPIYFVLGNHDFYGSSISAVRDTVSGVSKRFPHLQWLTGRGPVHLNGSTCLIGHDGWGDARLGDYHGSTVDLSDFYLIHELAGLSKQDRLVKLRQFGDEAAAHLKAVLPEALESADHVVVLTHVPPFRQAAWYQGRPSDDQWLPFFSCKAVGDVLHEAMESQPRKRMTVLCGHTHGGGRSQIRPNLLTLTGPARYGHPVIQGIFDLT